LNTAPGGLQRRGTTAGKKVIIHRDIKGKTIKSFGLTN